jgi:large subunit ribosomal protein L3e
MGGFPHYGIVKNDYLMLKGCTVGIRKRTLMLRKGLFAKVESGESDAINLKFIDTSSKFGDGRFQTSDEKKKFYGKFKKRTKKVLKKYLHLQKDKQAEVKE